MKKVPESTLAALAARFGYAADGLAFLGGGHESSDGIVYRADHQGTPYALKVVGAQAGDPGALSRVQARAAFFAYLGDAGVQVVSPKPNAAGNLIECIDGEEAYLAYQYPLLTGAHPSPETWTDEVIRAWGRTIGQTHRLTKAYPIWEGVWDDASGQMVMCWRSELRSFRHWCEDDGLKAYWQQLEGRIDTLAQTRDTMGFVHNDPHMQNILYEAGVVKLLDFDVANCHFFASDLAIAIQSVLFTRGGGMDRPIQDQAAIDWFVGTLLEGYTIENTLDAQALESIELFIAYRRALLLTVMHGWLATQPEALASWKAQLTQEPRILRLA